MSEPLKLTVAHAPFSHSGSTVLKRSAHLTLVALLAIVPGIIRYGLPALGVIALAISSAMLWEITANLATRRPISTGDGNAALIGALWGMTLPATSPWWVVTTGTFVAIIIGKQVFGGIGCNPFCPVAVAIAMLAVSWPKQFDFDLALLNYDLGFETTSPLASLKHVGVTVIDKYPIEDLLLGRYGGGIGSSCGAALITGGAYLIISGHIRAEIAISYILGLTLTATAFHWYAAEQYADPLFHLLTGYSLMGAFLLATDDASSPVHAMPMIIYGAGCGLFTILIRNIGQGNDGTALAILCMNLVSPLLDRMRPLPMGRAK
jgi:electron transport complex protein RnfD